MVLVTSSKVQRLLYMKFIDKVTAAEMRARHSEVQALVAEFDSGFRLLNDMQELQLMEDDCALVIADMMDLFKANGIELVVRIIPDPRKDIGLNILSVFHYGRNVRTVTCDTMAEGFKTLKL